MIRRIAIVAPEFNSYTAIHVPWRQIYEIATRLEPRGIDTAIITSDCDVEKFSNVNIINLEQKDIRNLDDKSKRSIMSFSPDILYWLGNPYSGTYMEKNKFDIPVVLHISSLHILPSELRNLSIGEVLQHRLQLATAFYPFNRVVSKLNTEHITGIISSTRTVTDRLVSLGVNPTKIITSPLFFESDLSADDVAASDEFVVCYAGPVDTIRGATIILEAVALLKSRGKSVKLLFLLRTDNPQRDRLLVENKIKKLGIVKEVEIIAGVLTRRQLANHLSSSHIVAIPTKYVWNEPPLIILEAMALGKLVITTSVCGIPEIVAGNALTIKPTAESFANKIAEMIENEESITTAGANAKAYVKSLPDWDAMTEWTYSTLEKFEKGDHLRG